MAAATALRTLKPIFSSVDPQHPVSIRKINHALQRSLSGKAICHSLRKENRNNGHLAYTLTPSGERITRGSWSGNQRELRGPRHGRQRRSHRWPDIDCASTHE